MKKRLIISSVISIFLVSILLIGSTYSIFTSQEIDETANVYKTGNLNVTYKVSSNTIQFTDPTPITTEEADSVIPYRITVTNTGNVAYEFDVILNDTTSSEENTIDYQYIMTKVGYLEPISLSNCTNNIIKENVIVPAGEKVDIDIRLWLDSTLPNSEMGNSFYAKLKIDGLAVYNDNEDIDNSSLSLRYMNTTNGTNYFNNDTYRTRITTASFVDYIDTSNAALDENEALIMWDMSSNQDKRIIAWLEENETTDEEGNKYYDLYIGSKDKIYTKSLYAFFQRMTNLEFINTETLNTSLSTIFNNFVYICSNLLEIDVSNFNTSNVNTMAYVFGGCEKLRELDVSNWDTSNVNTGGNNGGMRDLFQNCKTLKKLDVSNWDTSNVIIMFRVFGGCSSLTSLDVSNWDISSVTDISAIFVNCSSLTSLDLSNWNTSNITNMGNFFSGCSSLVSLDVSNFDTSNVTNMGGMFAICNNLVNLDVSNFDTSKVTSMVNMFIGCNNLLKLDVSNFDTSKVTDMRWMFSSCYNLEATLTVENINTSYTGMFGNAATAEGAQIIVNYIGDDPSTTDVNESTESLVGNMIATGTGNIINGGCTGDYCSI